MKTIRPDTIRKRKRSGWSDCDLLTPPLPANHTVNKARVAKPDHPWKTWAPGRFSRADLRRG